MSLMYKAMPEMVAEPLGWGTYKDDPDAYFFLCRFCEMSDDIPDVAEFTELVALMHKRNPSPNGQFGFDLVTYGGRTPQYFPPSSTWEECFSKGLDYLFEEEEKTQGKEEEFTALREQVFKLVIPRLLRPLETEGRTLTPRLVHGDLWDGNTSVDVNTGKPMIFDATPLYAHNECENIPIFEPRPASYTLLLTPRLVDELAPWWCSRHKMTDRYINEYIKHFQMAEPVEDFNDRGVLYNL